MHNQGIFFIESEELLRYVSMNEEFSAMFIQALSLYQDSDLSQMDESSRDWQGFVLNFNCEQNQRLLQHVRRILDVVYR